MLIENLKPQVLCVGGISLIPGMNQLTDSEIDRLKRDRYFRNLERLAKMGNIVISDSDRPKIEQVAVTYDEDLLLSWHAKAKGKLRKAIEDQLEKVKVKSEEE